MKNSSINRFASSGSATFVLQALTKTTGASASRELPMSDRRRILMDSSNAYIYAIGGTPIEQVNLSSGTSTYLEAYSQTGIIR
jgi:hypothetical protein